MCYTKQKPRSLGVVCERGKLPTPGVWLEVDLSSKLEDSRVKGRSDLAKVRRAKASAYLVKLRVIPRVEGFQTQFQEAAASFPQREPLEERQVPVVAPRSAQVVVWQGAPGADGWSRERTRAEPLINRMRSRECASQVWPVVPVHAVGLLIAGKRDIERQAGLHGDDAGDLPAADN